jgi:hypothetical protein
MNKQLNRNGLEDETGESLPVLFPLAAAPCWVFQGVGFSVFRSK